MAQWLPFAFFLALFLHLILAGCSSDILSESFASEASPLGVFEAARFAEEMKRGTFIADAKLCEHAGLFCHPYGRHGGNAHFGDSPSKHSAPALGGNSHFGDFRDGARSLEVLGGNAHFGDGGSAHFGDFKKDGALGQNAHFGDGALGGNAHFGDFKKDGALGQNAHFGDGALGGNAHFGDFRKGGVLGQNAHFGDGSLGGNAHFGDFKKDGVLGQNAHFGDGALSQNAHFGDGSLRGNAHFGDFKKDGVLGQNAHFGDGALGGNAHFGDIKKDEALGQNAHFGDGSLGGNAHFGDFKKDGGLRQNVHFGDGALGGNAHFDDAHFGDFKKDGVLGQNAHFGDGSLGGNAHFGDFKKDGALGQNAHFGDGSLGGNAHFGDLRKAGTLGQNAHFGDGALGGNAHFGDLKKDGTLGQNAHFGDEALGGNAHFGDFKKKTGFIGGNAHFGDEALGGNAHFGDLRKDGVLGGNAHFGDRALGGNAHFGDFRKGRHSHFEEHGVLAHTHGLKDSSVKTNTAGTACRKNMPLYLIQVFTEYENKQHGAKMPVGDKDWPTLKALITKCSPGMLHHFFTLEELQQRNGTTRILHNIRDTYPPRALLPGTMAQYTNFGKRNLDSYLREFNVPRDSPLSRKMAFTLELCADNGSNGKIKCVASVEEMAEFVTSVLGPVELSMVTGSKELAAEVGKEIKVGSAMPLTKGDILMVVCHTTMFPYKVYFCHAVSGTSAFKVNVKTSSGVDLTPSVLCHNMGDTYVCHWFVETVIMFAPASKVYA